MRYDPDYIKYYFNEEMILSPEGEKELDSCYKKFALTAVKKPYTMYGVKENQTGEKIKMAVGALWFIISVIALIWSVPVKRYDISGWVVVGFLMVIGLLMLFIPQKSASEYFSESVLSQRIQGAVLVAGGVFCICLQLRYNEMDTTHFLMYKWFILCIVTAVVMTVKLIGYLMAGKTVYKEEIDAVCIGYARTKEGSDQMPLPVNSPVFEYHHEGEKIQACYDVFNNGKDGNIPVGSNVKIRIDPDHPDRIMGNHKKLISGPLAFILVGIAGAIVLGYFIYK